MEKRLNFPEICAKSTDEIMHLVGRCATLTQDLVNKAHDSRVKGDLAPLTLEWTLRNGVIKVDVTASESNPFSNNVSLRFIMGDNVLTESKDGVTKCDFSLYRAIFATFKKFYLLNEEKEVSVA